MYLLSASRRRTCDGTLNTGAIAPSVLGDIQCGVRPGDGAFNGFVGVVGRGQPHRE